MAGLVHPKHSNVKEYVLVRLHTFETLTKNNNNSLNRHSDDQMTPESTKESSTSPSHHDVKPIKESDEHESQIIDEKSTQMQDRMAKGVSDIKDQNNNKEIISQPSRSHSPRIEKGVKRKRKSVTRNERKKRLQDLWMSL